MRHMWHGLPDVALQATGGDTMTQAELDALKALAAKATPGEWEEVAESGEWWVTSTSDEAGVLYVIPNTTSMAQDDVDYICAACNVVPALVAEVERLTARVAELEAELAAHVDEDEAEIRQMADAAYEAAKRRFSAA
jgi:hypothetical protein